jgi:hypothetical protein
MIEHCKRRTLGLFPPPLWGRVREGGGAIVRRRSTPTPNPSPQGGGERTEYAA